MLIAALFKPLLPTTKMIQTMKTLLLLSILASKIKTIVSATCCELDHTKPNVSNIYPVNGITVNANDWVTFKAEINDNRGVSSVNISIQGYILEDMKLYL